MTRLELNAEGHIAGETLALGAYTRTPKYRHGRKVLLIIAGVLAAAVFATVFAAYSYWRALENTPQYSLALLVEAARQKDDQTVDKIVDMGALVDDFVPQITAKAVEMYGRGQRPELIAKVGRMAAPLLPAVKDRARAELPRLIRRKTEGFARVPFAAMVVGADRYLEITHEGELAIVRSRLPEHSFEVRMRRNGDKWKIVGIRDERLAAHIARTVGQEIITIASMGPAKASENNLGVPNLGDLLREAEAILDSR